MAAWPPLAPKGVEHSKTKIGGWSGWAVVWKVVGGWSGVGRKVVGVGWWSGGGRRWSEVVGGA